jgi:SAM-dependent methyltransferase
MSREAVSYYEKNPAAAERYDALHAAQTEDVAFYVDEAVRSGGPVLEVGCGTGRVALAIARAGIDVVGLDRSAPMLAVGAASRRRAESATARRLTLVRADMRAFGFRRPFARVFLPFRVLQSMLTVPDQLAALAACRTALAPDGRLVFNVFDPRYDLLAAGSLPIEMSETGRGYSDQESEVIEKWSGWYDPVHQLLHGTFVYERRNAAGGAVDRAFEPLILRYFFRYEIEHLLARAGYEVEALYGGWARQPYHEHGDEMIWIARSAELHRTGD